MDWSTALTIIALGNLNHDAPAFNPARVELPMELILGCSGN